MTASGGWSSGSRAFSSTLFSNRKFVTRNPCTGIIELRAGPQRVEYYGGIPPDRETHAYMARVIDNFNCKKIAQQADSCATDN